MLDVHAPHEALYTWTGFCIHTSTIVVGLFIAISLEQTVEAFFISAIRLQKPATRPASREGLTSIGSHQDGGLHRPACRISMDEDSVHGRIHFAAADDRRVRASVAKVNQNGYHPDRRPDSNKRP
jgi:hypothetical protein